VNSHINSFILEFITPDDEKDNRVLKIKRIVRKDIMASAETSASEERNVMA